MFGDILAMKPAKRSGAGDFSSACLGGRKPYFEPCTARRHIAGKGL
jgi:hypothetical protein